MISFCCKFIEKYYHCYRKQTVVQISPNFVTVLLNPSRQTAAVLSFVMFCHIHQKSVTTIPINLCTSLRASKVPNAAHGQPPRHYSIGVLGFALCAPRRDFRYLDRPETEEKAIWYVGLF